jgi:cation diffusion facilitator CzcD-associated flavoprotein CzcO
MKLRRSGKSTYFSGRFSAWDESHNANKNRRLTVENLATGEIIEDDADVVVSARGILNEPVWPKVSGLKDFKGELMHSATWKDG